ncbi:MAG: bifunctional oligoribonuclease/PAP phosphatase NrnA [Clostridia bacterium]|nr:bifunctional oligoribonuclease/PAP phosphatase NrnA [Clostridia bacterium]
MNGTMQQIAERIKRAKSVLIMTHMRPDGDALGSALALFSALKKLNIRGQVCVESDIPSNLRFIQGVEIVAKKPVESYDLLVTVDCSDEQRLGLLLSEFSKAKRERIDTVNIDHHISNTRFAKYNFVQECAANCMHIATLIEYLGVPFDKTIAEYLLIGLLTDSGNFSHDDVTEECMLLAAKLIKAGADMRYYHYELFKKQPKARAKLYAKTMSGIRYYHEDRFAVITITQKAMEECGADQGMTEGFVDFPLNVETVEIAASLLEIRKGQYKISLRSKEYADVNKLAATFGGGGHIRAAGCMLFGNIEEVLDKLSYVAGQYLED